MRLFNRALSLGHVHEKINVKEGEYTISLVVDADVSTLAQRTKTALSMMQNAAGDRSAMEEAGFTLSRVMFGDEQTQRLLEFYAGNRVSLLEISLRIFAQRLSKKIEKAQRAQV